jgi:hypothetical protein
MTPKELLRRAADLSDADVDILSSALGWPDLEAVRLGVNLYLSEYRVPALFSDIGDAERFGPLVTPFEGGRLRVTFAGVCVITLRLLAEDTAAEDRRSLQRAETEAGEAFLADLRARFGG